MLVMSVQLSGAVVRVVQFVEDCLQKMTILSEAVEVVR